MKLKLLPKIIIFLIFILAFLLRIYGITWDQGYHLHPDERFLTMVETTIKLPSSFSQYLDTKNSPLNPYNYKEFQFFVYGTFPVFLVKYISTYINMSGYDQVYLVGRVISAFFDSLNIFGIYLLTKFLIKNNKNKFILFLPSLLYAFCILPIQLSHFFTVDTFLSPMLLFTFILLAYWTIQKKNFFLYLSAILFGLALSTKISAYLFSPIILLFFIYSFFSAKTRSQTLLSFLIFPLISLAVFRFFQPYAFVGITKFNPIFIDNMIYLKSLLTTRNVFYPPEIQWLSKTALVFPFSNILFWGLGLPISFLFLFKIKKIHHPFIVFCILFWVLLLLINQGIQFTSTMRYFLPIYPFIFILVGLIIKDNLPNKLIYFLISGHIIFSILFLSIYTRPHSRVQASQWIYQNIPADSKITNEYWDDPLPLNFSSRYFSDYKNNMLPLYDPDTNEKWNQLDPIIKNADYIIMSSNRLWGSIPQVPDKYPLTTKFYQELFDEKNNFKKVVEINSYPGINLPFMKKCIYIGPTNFPYKDKKNTWFYIDNYCQYPGIFLRDDTAEEAFTVYDHPKVLIYKNLKNNEN